MGAVISDTLIRIFQCISLPIIALSIVVTLVRHQDEAGLHQVWRKTLRYTIATTGVAATIACLLYTLIRPENVGPTPSAPIEAIKQPITYLKHLALLVPDNIFSPFLTHQVFGVLLVGVTVGAAIRYIPNPEVQRTVSDFFKGVHGIFMVITGWVVRIIPIGLYGFVTTTVVQMKEGVSFKGIGAYLAVVVLANCIQGFVVLPLWLKSHGIKPFVMMRAMSPALSLAFFSKSSAGTLPVTIETAERRLNIRPRISRFVLPLCTTINMNGCAAFIFTTVIYLMQNHGVEITFPLMLLWIVVATIAAIGNAGVPMGCFFLSTSLLVSMNIPIHLLMVILPVYGLIDMLETALNVWSDSCVLRVVHDTLRSSFIDPDPSRSEAPQKNPLSLCGRDE